jgi:hypothetical protein
VNGQLTSMSWSYQDPVYDRWGAASGIQYVSGERDGARPGEPAGRDFNDIVQL